MVSLRDFDSLAVPGAEFSELLLFDGELERPDYLSLAEPILRALPPCQYLHVQEFVSHRGRSSLVDLASEDEEFRTRCVEIVRKTRALAGELGGIPVVMHPGGIRHDTANRKSLLSNLGRSLMELGGKGLLLENMPWFYWHRKTDRMYSNLCVLMEDMKRFENLVDGFVLDLCHGYLSRPEGDPGYCRAFLREYGSKVKHLHVSDARVPDKEGLQIGDGDIDFSVLKGSNVPITVEVWNGHIDDGVGFGMGIERLRMFEKEW